MHQFNQIINDLAPHFPERTLRSLRDRIYLLEHPFHGANASWTADDKERLCSLVRQHGKRWNYIGDQMGRVGDNCKSVHRKMNDKRSADKEVRERVKRRQFHQDEVRKLVECVMLEADLSNNTGKISRKVVRRLLKQEKSEISWDRVTSTFNQDIASTAQKRHSAALMEKWRISIVPALKSFKSEWPFESRRVSMNEFANELGKLLASDSVFTVEDDLLLLKRCVVFLILSYQCKLPVSFPFASLQGIECAFIIHAFYVK
jgi:hypothetical protein